MRLRLWSRAASHLSVRVLDGGYVTLAERPLDETQHEAALADSAGAEHDDAVVVALFGHFDAPSLRYVRQLRIGRGEIDASEVIGGGYWPAVGSRSISAYPPPLTLTHRTLSSLVGPDAARRPNSLHFSPAPSRKREYVKTMTSQPKLKKKTPY